MAKELIIDVKVEGTQEAVSNIQQLEQEMEKLNQQKEELLKSPSVSTGDFVKKLDEIDSQLGKLERSYQSATGKAEKFEKAQKNLEGVAKTIAGSVGIATSALATFGIKNEEVEKTLLKVQSAAAFSQGLKDLQEGFKALDLTFGTLTKTMLANPFVLIATLVAALVGYFGGFEKIISVVTGALGKLFEGVTSLLSGLGSLIGVQTDYKNELDATTASIEKYEAALDGLNARYTEEERNLNNQIELLKAQGATTEEIAKAESELIKTRRNNSATLIAENKLAIAEFAGITDKSIKLTDKLLAEQSLKRIQEITKNISDEKERDAKVKELTEKRNQLFKNLSDSRINRSQEETNLEIKNAQAATDAREKNTEKYKQAQDKRDADAKKKIQDDYNAFIESEQAKVALTEKGSTARLDAEISAINAIEKYQNDNATNLGLTQNRLTIIARENIEKRKSLEDEYYTYVSKLRNIDIDEIKYKNATQQRIEKITSDVLMQINDADFRTRRQRAEDELKEIAADADKSNNIAQKSASVISDLGNLVFDIKKRNLEKGSKEEEEVAKKQFKFNKALQLGLAVMDGFKAITASLAQSPVAVGVVPNPAGIASLAFAAATSAVNIAKIASTKFESSLTASAPTAPTPSINSIPASGSITPTSFNANGFGTNTSQSQTLGAQQGNGGGTVVRAYITESDLLTTTNRLNGIRTASEL